MNNPAKPPKNSAETTSRIMFFTMLGLIIAFILAFIVLRPDPGGGGHRTNASQARPEEK